jgi:hypothetical protein
MCLLNLDFFFKIPCLIKIVIGGMAAKPEDKTIDNLRPQKRG